MKNYGLDIPNPVLQNHKAFKIRALSLNLLNRYKFRWSENALYKGRCERRLVRKCLFLLVCQIFGALNQPTEIIQAIHDLLLLFQFLRHFFLFFLFVGFYSLHQNTFAVAMHLWFVSVDAKDFGDVVLVDFE